jgi:hypothetical protein
MSCCGSLNREAKVIFSAFRHRFSAFAAERDIKEEREKIEDIFKTRKKGTVCTVLGS